jgi:hypothetical protein
VLVPIGNHPPTALKRLDAAVKSGTPPEELLARQDDLVLKPLGITATDRDTLKIAWRRLRDRRHRTPSQSAAKADAPRDTKFRKKQPNKSKSGD